MSQTMTLELSDEIYEAVQRAAAENGLNPREWIVNNLRQYLLAPRPGSAQAIIWAMSQPPHLKSEDVDELERAIEEGKLPVNWNSIFEDDAGTRP